jgi:hypothetical protein
VLVATYKVAIAEQRESELYSLPLACKSLADEWSTVPRAALMRDPEPLGELLYLCARIGAQDAADSVARVAGREELASVFLQSSEDLQCRALRCLAGLLPKVNDMVRNKYKEVFQSALSRPSHSLSR